MAKERLGRRDVLKLAKWSFLAWVAQACTSQGEDTPMNLATEEEVSPASPSPLPTRTLEEATPTGEVTPTEEQAANTESCIYITDKEKVRAGESLDSVYEWYKENLIVPAGTDSLRVDRIDDNLHDTPSEAIGYGMLLALGTGDETTVRGLWNFAKQRLNHNGLMFNKIDTNGLPTADANTASDADLDIGAALTLASKRWAGFREDAKTYVNNILVHDIEAGTNVLKPGDGWGGSDTLNPSYISPAYFRLFSQEYDEPLWEAVALKQREILKKVADPVTGLVPDWTNAQGGNVDQILNLKNSGNYGWEAIRLPIRLAMAVMQDCGDEVGKAAIEQLHKLNMFFEGAGIENIPSGYTLNGKPAVDYGNQSPFIAAQTAASIVSSNEDYRQGIFDLLDKTTEGSYYGESIRGLALLTMSARLFS